MHIDDAANHLVLVWCAQRGKVRGGEFVIPGYGVYWPMVDNQLFWFQNRELHGTAILDHVGDPINRLTMACSVPRRLWNALTAKGVSQVVSARVDPDEVGTSASEIAEPSYRDDVRRARDAGDELAELVSVTDLL